MTLPSNAPVNQGANTYTRLFRSRNFMALWIGQMISFIGDYFYFLAIPIVVSRLTGSALMVGLSAIAGALPALLLGPVAGVFVDRWDRRRTMLVSDIVLSSFLGFWLIREPDQHPVKEKFLPDPLT
jgi:MFS family permease